MLDSFRYQEQRETMQGIVRALRQSRRAPRSITFKPAFSVGFRGWPRTLEHTRQPAPTIDQVRNLEQKYGEKLIVAKGLVWFKDKVPFTHEKAQARQRARHAAA